MVACLGNHEVVGGYGKTRKEAPFFYSLFDGLFPETGYATLDFGDYLSLVLLDTGHTSPIEGAQTDWLARTLKEREERPTVFAFNHVPAYPSYRPMSSSDDGEGERSREPQALGAAVRAIQRRRRLRAPRPHVQAHASPAGRPRRTTTAIIYLGDGSWGQLRAPKSPEERPYLAVTHKAYHSSVHRIEGRERFHMALSDVGQIVDVCVTTKRSHRRTT